MNITDEQLQDLAKVQSELHYATDRLRRFRIWKSSNPDIKEAGFMLARRGVKNTSETANKFEINPIDNCMEIAKLIERYLESKVIEYTAKLTPVGIMNRSYYEWIDNATLEELLVRWRFGAVGDTIFCGHAGQYFKARMEFLRSESPEEYTKISKRIGFNKP